jgi:hypothetical protein|tara:strand:+ start:355 stop:957 length:603 start_codon:yes stop_codon:yes gene_type:complete
MKLEVLRISSQEDSTSGILFETTNGKRTFMCYTIEDEQRDVKVWGETRIPAGTYKLKLRTEGGFHSRYTGKYGDWHKGMIWVQDVPGFEYILWHTGNTDESTAGCLILGQTQESNLIKPDGWVGSSVSAYKFVYPRVSEAILSGQDVEVTYIDYDGDISPLEKVDEIIKETQIFDVEEKLQEISGEIKIMSAKLDGKRFW